MKKGKTFLKIGLVLLGVAAVIGAGFFITGSVVFARNAIAFALLGGTGIGVATPIVKGFKKFFANRAEKKLNNLTKRTQELNREIEKIHSLGSVPNNTNTVEVTQNNNTVVSTTTKKKVTR